MKILVALLLFLMLPAAGAPPTGATPVVNCEEWAKKTEQTFRKMDEALKLKSGMLLGEMEMAKGALEGCIAQNVAVNTRMAIIWFLAGGSLLLVLGLVVLHQSRMKRTVRMFTKMLQTKDPTPAWPYWTTVTVIGFSLVLINLFALIL